MSLKQSNEQVDYMFYLLKAPFSWNMARQQHVKCTTRWVVSWAGDDMTQTGVVDSQALPSGERVATTLQKIFPKCIKIFNTIYFHI